MTAAEEQAVEILNNAKLAGNAQEKVQLLKTLQEIVVKRDPNLIPTFIPEVLELQVDPSPVVRRALLDFFDVAMQAKPTPSTILIGLQCIQFLLQDSIAATVKRAVISAYPTYRAALALAVLNGSAPTEETQQMWNAAGSLKTAVVSLATGDAPNSGVKLSACKFIEQAGMLLTADVVPAVPGVLPAPRALPADNVLISKAQLVKEGEALVAAVNTLVKSTTQQEVAAPVAMTCIRAAMTFVQQRPQFMGRIMPTLLSLARSSAFGGGAAVEGAPPAEQNGPAATALKAALSAALNSSHPMAQAWKKKVTEALTAMGAPPPEPKPQQPRQRASKRAREEEEPQPPRQAPAVPVPSTTTPVPMVPASTPAIPAAGPDIAALRQLDTTLRGLIAAQNAGGIAQVVSSLPPATLADLVTLYLPNLPPRNLLPPNHLPHAPWLENLMAELWPQTETAATETAAAAVQDPRRAGGTAANVTTTSTTPAPTDPRLAASKAAPSIAPMPIPKDVLAPIPLTEQDKANQRKNAVIRILQTQKTSAHALRTGLIARLTACAPDSDRITESVIEYLMGDFHNRGGLEVSLAWLYLLFTEAAGNTAEGPSRDPSTSSSLQGGELLPSSNSSNSGLAGSRYEDVLLSILEGLKERLPPSDRTILSLLAEVPALPMPRIAEFLASMCTAGGEWVTLALIAARDVAVGRPPSREPALRVALEAATSTDSDVRTKAVRLLANRLFPEATMTAAIENYAKEQLQMLVPKPKGEALQADTAIAIENGVGEKKEKLPKQLAESNTVEPMEEGGEGKEEKAAAEEEGIDGEKKTPMEEDTPVPKAAAAASEEESVPIDEEAEASRRCALYCALCTKKHSLLRKLFEVYGCASAPAQKAIASNAPGLAKTMGATAAALLTVIQDPPSKSMELVLVMLGVLTQAGTPPQLLVTACMQLFNSCKDPRALAPALPGMDRSMVLRLLPSILDLPPDILKPTIARLVSSPAPGADGATSAPPLFTPSEFLVALHTFDTGSDATVMRKAMAAIHVCISSPELFPSEALATTINQLLSRSRLPPLFMRTVLQSLVAAPRLRTYVVSVLGQLAAKQVWNNPTQWRGWVMAAQQTAPDSFPIWLQLPTNVLEQALGSVPAELKAQLAAYAQSPQCQVAFSAQTKAVLMGNPPAT